MRSEKDAQRVIRQARHLGAHSAGLADLTDLLNAPSYQGPGQGVNDRTRPGLFERPAPAGSILVLALAHPGDQPRLDWWDGRQGTQGNRILIDISKNIKTWLTEELNIRAALLPYQAENGGLYLKDAAVLAGLGVIGANNLLITPKYGPRVRLRALFLDRPFPTPGPIDFSPCLSCPAPCLAACPQKAFRTGGYALASCDIRMAWDCAHPLYSEDADEPDRPVVGYCRACELVCPAGRGD